MRLIEKKEIIVLYPCTGDKSYDDGFFYGAKEVMGIINNAPTIDAIPTDWLRDVMLHGEPEESKIAWKVLKLWQKEQEAR